LVDDDADLRLLSTRVLVRSGYSVDNAGNGQDGWEALLLHPYNLLITDHNMPRLSGLNLIKKLRATGLSLPVILMSGALPTREIDESPWLLLSETLLKPFTDARLREAVKLALLPSTIVQEAGSIARDLVH